MYVDKVNYRPGLDSFLFFSKGKDVGHRVASILEKLQLSQERLHVLPTASQHRFSATQTDRLFWPSGCLAKTVYELPRPGEGMCGQRSLKVCSPCQVSPCPPEPC